MVNFVFALIFTIIFHTGEVFSSQLNEIGIITVNNLNMRPMPGIKNKPLLRLKKGARVKILKHEGGWLKVIYEGKVGGYIRHRDKFVKIVYCHSIEEGKNNKSDLDKKVETYKKEAESIELEIQQSKAEVTKFAAKEKFIINSLNEVDFALNQARKRVASIRDEIDAIENKILDKEKLCSSLQKEIEVNRNYAAKRLVALYKLNCIGRMRILASSDSMFEMFQRKKALERILASDENILKSLESKYTKLNKLKMNLSAQKTEKLSLETDLEKQVWIMSEKRKERSLLLEDIRNKKSVKLAVINSLKAAASALDDKIRFLEIKNRQASFEKSENKSFASLKGKLNMPVKGNIVSFFGSYKNTKFNVVNFQSGIDIRAKRGEPIHAVYDGKILFARWFKGYGNMIIIDHGENYYTLYAHADELFAVKGEIVEKGEVVATVGDTGSISGQMLHFEVRHHGKPVDPLDWLKQDQKG